MSNGDGGIVGYNVQTAVDTKHHLIVAHEVINAGIDRNQLTPMAAQAREATGSEARTVVADRGYFKGEQILECEQAGITPLVPKSMTSNSKADGRFDKQHFIYIASDVQYRGPAGHGDQALYHCRARHDPEQVLVLRLPRVSAQGAMHDERSAHHPLGTRANARQMCPIAHRPPKPRFWAS